MTQTRRKFIRNLSIAALGGGLGLGGGYYYSRNIEPEWLTIERLTLPIQQLGDPFEGFKLVQLSDLHLHPYTQIDFIEQVVAATAALQPDLVVLTGDYVIAAAESIFELAPVLARLNPRYGLVAILGNHDLWTNAAVVVQGFSEVGIPVLKNSGFPLTIGADMLYLAGLDDGWSGQPDLSLALSDAPHDVPVILLMHEPDYADYYSLDGRVALQLSGHSHGGQVRLPGLGAIRLPRYGRKYDSGLYQVNDMWLYTNRGIGVMAGVPVAGIASPPVRFNCPPEITEITLTRAV